MDSSTINLTCWLIQRIVVPLVLLLCALFRPVGISYVYLLMFFICPFLPLPSLKNFRGSISAYYIVFISLSVLLILCHTVLQILILVQGYDDIIGSPCSFTELLLRHIGFISFLKLGVWDIIKWIAPDVIALISSILTFVLIKKQTIKPKEIDTISRDGDDVSPIDVTSKEVNFNILFKLGPTLSLVSLLVTGTLRPSIPGLIYFVIFLASGTYWATFKTFNRGFARILQISLAFLVCHIIIIISYQTPWPQQYIKSSDLIPRYFGLEPLVTSDCEPDIRIINYNSFYKFHSFLLPILILISYHILAITIQYLLTIPSSSISNTLESNIPLESISIEEDEPKITVIEQIFYGIKSVAGFIHENSYIFTNVLMMIWSIVYHSWLSFVFLIWANVLWMIPNQRKAMMRSSPLIVFYAELLLLIDYIYAIYVIDNINSKTSALNVRQIGLHKPNDIPIINFLVKTTFTLIFWVTLRQTCKESTEKARSTVFLDYVSKARVQKHRKGSAQPETASIRRPSLFFKKSGDVLKNLLVRLWIWLLLIIIFMCAVTGKDMTAFRICYMALFLFFLLAFQISARAWIKLMYGFWIFLIFYAMSILILIYTYQFDNFNQYWTDFLNMSEGLQDDVGLQKYKTKDLFLHLVSPTAIVILTVIQVHYFHKRLVDSMQNLPNESKSATDELNSNVRIHNEQKDNQQKDNVQKENEQKDNEQKDTDEEPIIIKRFSKKWILLKLNGFHSLAKYFKEFTWEFLEIHLLKVAYITAFLCCISEVCVLHIFIAVLCVVGIVSNRKIQMFLSRAISFLICLIILTKMIYQIGYLDHSSYNVNCKNDISPDAPENTAVWFGLQKTSTDQSLIHIIKKYIIYMLIVTINAVVLLRQNLKRLVTGNNKGARVLFPGITRKDAEKNMKGLVKYLFNYGFYKFGLEITLIALVILISYRKDVIAIPYVVWLCILIFLDRSDCAKLWPFFQSFTAILIIVQYIFFVRLPPGLCIEKPWQNTIYDSGLQLWGLLPGNSSYIHGQKLIYDFILLMFITQQKHVFNKEKKIFNNSTEYPGGSNKSVVNDINNLGIKNFENPTSDFITNVRNWLDVYMNAVLCGLYWITLALLFMAGTYRADILAIGYLVGSCVFLWQGTDFYIRPISQILKWWNILILYNIINIVVGVLLNIVRYLYLNTLMNNNCWVVHLFGLSYPDDLDTKQDNSTCPPVVLDTNIYWDAFCFAFLILQLRIFKSHYFCHIINDTKANLILASRGAELIEDLRKKQIEHKKKHEQEVLLKIKQKMEKIRSNQQRLSMREPDTHFRAEDDIRNSSESSNISSCPSTGYHTPRQDNIVVAEVFDDGEDVNNDYEGLFISPNTNIQNTAPSSSSVAMTISLEEYLEPKRLSFESHLEFLREQKQSIDSTHLLSPASALKPSTMQQSVNVNGGDDGNTNDEKQHRRQSSGNTVSWNEPIEKLEMDSTNVSLNDIADNSIILRRRHSSRRHSILNTFHIYDDQLNKVCCCRRRFSNISFVRDDKTRTSNIRRPYSWGPTPHICYLEPLISTVRPQPTTHHQSISAGDYYMFDDMDEKFKLDFIEQDKGDFLEDQEKKIEDAKAKTDAKTDTEPSKSEVPDDITSDDSSPDIIKTGPSRVEDYNCINRIKIITRKVLTYFSSKINGLSRNYRYVMKVLNQEKKILKESKSYEKGGDRAAAAPIWTPFVYLKKHLLSKEGEPEAALASAITTSDGIITYDIYDKFTSRRHNIIIELLISIWYAVLSNTDILCYFVIFLNQVVNASIVSLPLPLMVFLWGTLSLSRPTKTFWVTLIAYTQSIVFIKAIFQFKSLWSNYANLPSEVSTANIVGIEVDKRYAVFDLVLLLFLFSHRVVLKSQGLWKSENRDDVNEEHNLIAEDTGSLGTNTGSPMQQNMDNTSFTSVDENSVILATKQHTQVASGSAIEIRESEQKEPVLNIPGLTKFTCVKYFSSMRDFFYDLVYKARLPVDVYALMFLCDFTNFFVLLFGFTAFGGQSSDTGEGVQKYLQENKVPVPFLIMLLIQFILIVIDRALYLRKALVNKIIFHFFSVIGIHIWMFFILPIVTELRFYSLMPPVIFYLIKCIYLLLSSYQIKCGYPKRILGNFLTRGYTIWNMIAFKLYMLMPFLYELRTLLDWVCTETTMAVGNWLKMEDIFTDIFCIKCARQFETDYPAARGATKPIVTKLLLGGLLVFIIIILIWGPLSLFAIGNAVGQPNVPYKASASLQIGTYDPVYQTSRDSIYSFDKTMLTQLEGTYISDKQALAFITNYDASDIAAIIYTLNSPVLWHISPPDKQNLLNDLTSKKTLKCSFKYSIFRIPPTDKTRNEISSEVFFTIDKDFEGRDTLIQMLQGTPTDQSVKIPSIYPKFIKVLNSGDLTLIPVLMQNTTLYRTLFLKIFQEGDKVWWQIKEDCSDEFYKNTLERLPRSDCENGIVMYTFNDKKFPSTFNILTGGGIIGLYTTFVLVASKILKSVMTGQRHTIMYVDLPYADRVLQLCLDVYLVREALEFTLEEDLFAKLIFLYRSPATMIKWTQPVWRHQSPDNTDSVRSRTNSERSRTITIRE